ncbi:MAG: ATP-binding protein, partial [Candidatus Latescibacterota bacterium]
SKIEAGREELQLEDFDLADLMQGLKTMFQLRSEQKGLRLLVELDAMTLQVHGDVSKLRQVLVNLLGNAVKFTHSGEVALKVSAKPDDHFHFEVFDTGPGISEEQQATIFDPFQRATVAHQAEGSGLGLAIAYGYVQMMGGQLAVDSVPGVETRFTFTLHLPPALSEIRQAGALADHLALGEDVIALVVDDVAQNRDILAKMLRRVGVTVGEVSDGKQALAWVADRIPHIVFMDILMPAMSGVETMQTLRETYGRDRFKIVAVSAAVLDHQHKAYLEAGFDGFLDKPIQMNRVYDMLAHMLGVAFVDAVASDEKNEVDVSSVVLPEVIFAGLEKA